MHLSELNAHNREVFITSHVQVISAECVDGPAAVLAPKTIVFQATSCSKLEAVGKDKGPTASPITDTVQTIDEKIDLAKHLRVDNEDDSDKIHCRDSDQCEAAKLVEVPTV
ncbi:hypothetical protein Ancab_033367 [Ancistrocladus abbreviatus]